MFRVHAQRSELEDGRFRGLESDVAHHHVADDGSVHLRDERELRDEGVGAANHVDDGDLVGASEGGSRDGGDRVRIAASLRPNLH